MSGAIVAVVIGNKLLSGLISGIIPLSFVSKGYGARFVEDFEYSFEMTSAIVIFFSSFYFFFRQRISEKFTVMSLLFVLFVTMLFAFDVIPEPFTLKALLFGCNIGLLSVSNFALALSLRSNIPLTRYKLLATVCVQVLHLLVLFFDFFSRGIVLSAIAVVSFALIFWGTRHKGASSLSTKSLDDDDVEFKKAVTLQTAAAFLLICIVGLNGEQMIDASLKLSLKKLHWEGNKGPIAVHHAVTAVARLIAFGSPLGPKSAICIWGIVQLLRVFVMSYKVMDSIFVVIALISLDKWSGSIGEIALEKVLMKTLQNGSAIHATIPAIFLMSLYQPIEDITGSLVKIIVRVLPFQTLIFVALILVSFVVAYILRTFKEEKKKEKVN